jgi:hypothetical protein
LSLLRLNTLLLILTLALRLSFPSPFLLDAFTFFLGLPLNTAFLLCLLRKLT